MTNRNVYFVGGVSGVGKSTFLNKLKEINNDFEIIYGSNNTKRIRKIFPENTINSNEKLKLLSFYLNKTIEIRLKHE